MFRLNLLKRCLMETQLEIKNRELSFANEKKNLEIENLRGRLQNLEERLDESRLLLWHLQYSYDRRIGKLVLNGVEKECKGNRQRLLDFRNKHQGERCFIVGNGPSLIPDDLEKIKNEISFGVNKINEIYRDTDWRPTYYLASDPLLLEKQNMRMAEIKMKSTVLLDSDFFEGIIPELRDDVVWYHHVSRYTVVPEFSNRPDEIVYEGGSVLFHAIQFAVFMGIKEIYLIGVDNNYRTKMLNDGRVVLDFFSDSPTHFYSSGDEERIIQESCEGWMDYNNLKKTGIYDSNEMWKAVKYHCEINSVQVYNATRGGMLEIFNRIKLEDIINIKK